jgi:lysine 2,3-aminomutase
MIDFFSEAVRHSREWHDWRWQFQHRLSRLRDFEPFLDLCDDEREGFETSANRFSTGVTPYVLVQMDRSDPGCPIRKQYLPSARERNISPVEMEDPCSEQAHSPVPGIVHRYPDRVLFLVTDMCAVYCRYCTRSRLVGRRSGLRFHRTMEHGIRYISENPQVRDVLISGGDPLVLSDAKLDALLSRLRAIPHVELIRIGTRMPIVIPQRVTGALCRIFEKHHPFFMSLHINHPRELTGEVYEACDRLTRSGIPLGSQTVLLRRINDSPKVMKELVRKLLRFRIKPYYLYQCDPVRGTGHLRTSLSRGMEIMRNLRGFTTGYAIPDYVVDAPGGGGKVPMEPANVVSQRDGVIYLRNWEGRIFEYREETSPESAPRFVTESHRPVSDPAFFSNES